MLESKNDPKDTLYLPLPKLIAFFRFVIFFLTSYVPGGGDCDLLILKGFLFPYPKVVVLFSIDEGIS